MYEALQGEMDPNEAIEFIGFEDDLLTAEWIKEKGGYSFQCPRRLVVHVEMFAAGGGGGGSTRGAKGGGGGRAGKYEFKRLELDPGRYVIEVGIGGQGGRSHQKNEADSPATDGSASSLKSWTGLPFLHCAGGAGGTTNGSPSATGESGEDVIAPQGNVLSHGGEGGAPDRPGYPPGKGQWGAGAGGGGRFAGPSNYYSGNGAHGHVRIFFVS